MLAAGARIEIIALNHIEDGNELSELVAKHDNGRVIRATGIPELTEHTAHFVLVGDRRYRIETDDGRKDAIACFNNQTVGQVLENAFNAYKKRLVGE